MINSAKFQIIGRIGSVTKKDKVTYISIASYRRAKNEWHTETNWNTITVFGEALRNRISNPSFNRHGNLIVIEGSIQSSSYMKDGEKSYNTTLAAQDIEIFSFAKETK